MINKTRLSLKNKVELFYFVSVLSKCAFILNSCIKQKNVNKSNLKLLTVSNIFYTFVK